MRRRAEVREAWGGGTLSVPHSWGFREPELYPHPRSDGHRRTCCPGLCPFPLPSGRWAPQRLLDKTWWPVAPGAGAVPALWVHGETPCLSAQKIPLFCTASAGAHHCRCTMQVIFLSRTPLFTVKRKFISHFISQLFGIISAFCHT